MLGNNRLFSLLYCSGAVHLHDVRVANHHVGTLTGHTQEVCGMQWSPDCGRLLATGGNDNQVMKFLIMGMINWL